MITKNRLLSVSVLLLLILQTSCSHKITKLFNQKDLDGWYAYRSDSVKYDNGLDLFKVEDGVIKLYGEKSGYLMSKESFKNFKLTVEFKWNEDPSLPRRIDEKNSGVMYLVPEDAPDMFWPKGIQFQVKEGSTGDFILLQDVTLNINGKRTTAGKSVVMQRIATAEKPAGEWNTLVITVNNGVIKQELNGVLVNEAKDPSVKEGRILLQYEGYPIDFRKVEVEKL
ncbi:DUF1080 domain-containing protein [Weeksellaceae bacterium TAE3-ERU29]|nr:DUF1080 domain-containing protein [Weeksellaceae bacterium TAE3-ERU29]